MVTTSMTRQRQASLTTGLLTEEDENALVGGQSHYPRHHHHHCSDMVGGGGGGGGRHVNGDSRNHHLHMHHLYHHHHHHRHHHGSGREDSGIGSEATSEPSSGVSSGHGSHVLDHQALGLDPTLISSLSLQERPDVDEDGDDLQSHQSSRDADDDDDDDNDDQDRASSSTDSKTTAATMFTSMRHKFQANHPHRLHITSLEQSLMGQLAIKLLESIFFDNRMDRFFSFTQTDTTLSIIMDDATLSLFPDNTLNTQAGSWRLISIGEGPLGFDECGIVSEFSRPLSEQGIGLFYLSTFKSDYIMVNDQDFDQAVEHLKETARRTSVSGSGAGSEPGSVASSPSLGSGSMAFEEVAAAEL
ncbi:GATS protein-like 3 [Lunasporangiospora selenospora]|uniref:GATS protein-like 3 n=1 Tax=Lunasporangiospora selenospora TaxID=979761 RepID=A0A9P6KC57_9FUNG|nr:GATS protein-like 3 [Lunasporangiospora selenospora]